MTVSKYEVSFTKDSRLYSLTLYDSDIFGEEGDKSKITVNGKHYAIAVGVDVPVSVARAFDTLRGQSFSSDEELIRKLEDLSGTINVVGVSLTKRIYNLATEALLSKQNLDSAGSAKLKHHAYSALKTCNPDDQQAISKIIRKAQCSVAQLFDIADKIESEGMVVLAEAIRVASRPFNMDAALKQICQKIRTSYFNEAGAGRCVAYITDKLRNGGYKRVYDAEEFTALMTKDLREISHDGHFELVVKSKEVQGSDDIRKAEIQKAEKLKELQAINYGFGPLQHLGKGIYSLDISLMANPKEAFDGRFLALEKAKSILADIQKANPSAMIFDLRHNHGGSPYMSELFLSYFNKEDIPLSSGRGITPHIQVSADSAQEKAMSLIATQSKSQNIIAELLE